MENYICIDGQKTEITREQAALITNCLCKQTVELSRVAVGDTVKIGSHEMIVLEQYGDATSLIKKDILLESTFGANNNYVGSHVDERCNEFAREISDMVGETNMMWIAVDLTSDDGLKDYGTVDRRASLLTADQYRRYVAVLDMHKLDNWWWLSTPFTTPAHLNDYRVLCVSPSGCINDIDVNNIVSGVRPFCILKSDIFVSK
jgi:hypothetical protein